MERQALLFPDNDSLVAAPPPAPEPVIDPMARDLLARTIIGEAGNQPLEGQAGVAHVVLNRLNSGRWGQSIPDVLFAPKQFEPWNTRRDELLSIPQDDPRYKQAVAVADGVMRGKMPDPTKGATHFANAEIVAQRGNAAGMSWINNIRQNGTGQQIGNHLFGNPDAKPQAAAGPVDRDGNPLPPRNVGEPAAAPPRPFFKPQPGIPVRAGVDMDGISEGARGVFGALAKLNIPGLEVVSGYRDPARNARVGGAKGSQHIHGNAIDIDVSKLDDAQKQQVIDAAIAAGARGVGIYPGGRSLHFDTRETPAAWGANPAAPYSGVSDPNAYPAWARPSIAKLFGGELPAMAYASRQPGQQQAQPQQRQPLNPTVQAAANRGRDPRANMPAPDANVAMGQMPMPARQAPPDATSQDNAGIRDLLLYEAGQSPQQQAPAQGGGGIMGGIAQAIGGLGGLGGIRIPGGVGGGATPGLPQPSLNPFAFGAAARENEQVMRRYRGEQALVQELVRRGIPAEEAVNLIGNETALKFRLATLSQQQSQAATQAAVQGLAGSPQQAQGQGAPAATGQVPQAGQPATPGQPASGPGKSVMNDPVLKDTKVTTRARMTTLLGVIGNGNVAEGVREAAKEEYKTLLKNSEMTQDQKEHAAALADGSFNGGVYDYIVGIKKAGKAETNVNIGAEKSYDQTVGKAYGEKFVELQKTGADAVKTLGTVQLMENLMNDPNFSSGFGAETKLKVNQALVGLGVAKPNAASSGEAFKALSNQMILDGAGGSLGNQISNGDRDFIRDTAANYNNTPDGNKKLLDVRRKQAMRQQEVAKMARDYATRNGRLDAGFDKEVAEFAEANPLFPQTPAQQQTPQAAAPAPATNVRPDGSSPPTPGQSGPVKVFTKADYDKLPPGAEYVDPQGNQRRKGGN